MCKDADIQFSVTLTRWTCSKTITTTISAESNVLKTFEWQNSFLAVRTLGHRAFFILFYTP